MIVLISYILLALVCSFLCSIAEAVILSVTSPYIAHLQQQGRYSGSLLATMKADINEALSAILTLNTIAHTIGAAGAGAQAARLFGSAWLGVFSAVLTLLILVFSEIIPKTLGAHYWKQLAPLTAFFLRLLIWCLYPLVKLSGLLTRGLVHGPVLTGFNRAELAHMADISASEGQLGQQEHRILKNLLHLRDTRVTTVMTPRTVIFSLPTTLTVEEYFWKYQDQRFSRIPVYHDSAEKPDGFVLRSDLLLAQARGNTDSPLSTYRREMPVLPAVSTLSQSLDLFQRYHTHIMLVVDEYGETAGLVTLEDILETLLGLEIVDEGDRAADMQLHARQLWQRRARAMGISTED